MRSFLVLALAFMLLMPSFAGTDLFGQFDPGNGDRDVVDERVSGIFTPNVSLFDNFTTNLQTDAMPRKVAAGDLNNDGRNDLAVIYYQKMRVDVYFQTPNGTFPSAPSKSISTPGIPTSFTLGDMNNDRLLDVVICYPDGFSGWMVFYYQKAGPTNLVTNISRQTSQVPLEILAGDFDGDLKNDTAVASHLPGFSDTGQVEVHKNFSNFGTSVIANLNGVVVPNLLCYGDYDNDGKLDIAIGDTAGNQVLVYHNTWLSFISNYQWTRVATFDSSFDIWSPTSIEFINGDGTGNNKLAISTSPSSGNCKVIIYQNNTSNFIAWKQITAGAGLAYAKGIDLNGDGWKDIALIYNNSAKASYYYTPSGSTNYGSSPAGSFPCQDDPFMLLAKDMNGDGAEDLIIAQNRSATAGAVTVSYTVGGLLSNSNENLWSSSGQMSMIVGNFTRSTQGIGILDRTAGRLNIYDAGWHSIVVPATVDRVAALRLFDPAFDDIVLSDAVNGSILIYPSGSSIYSPTLVPMVLAVPSPLTSPRSLTSFDVDMNGHADLVVGCLNGFVIFYNSGTGGMFDQDVYEKLDLAATGNPWIMTGNFNSATDQDNGLPPLIDVAVVNTTSNKLDIYYQQQPGAVFSVANRTNLSAPSGTISWADSADMNSDGLVDIVIGTSDGYVVLYYQTSLGLDFTQKTSYKLANGFYSAALGDYNDDDKKEVAVIGSQTSTVSLLQYSGSAFKLDSFQTAGAGSPLVAIGDADGDRRKDVVVGSPGSGSISVWYQRNMAPHALWSTPQPIATEGLPFVLDATASYDSYSDDQDLIYSWSWRLGTSGPWTAIPSEPSSPILANAIFPSWGLYHVNLTVTDRAGLSSSSVQDVRVMDGVPSADFVYSGTMIEGVDISFADTSTSPVDPITYLEWDFGDGSAHVIQSARANPVLHRYLSNGTFNVTLTVGDGQNSSSMTKALTITDSQPVFSIQYQPGTIVEGSTVTFTLTRTSPDPVTNYLWSLNGTTLSSGTDPSIQHLFGSNGWFWVNVTLTENDGDLLKNNVIITVQDTSPTANFTMSASQVLEGDFVTFQDTSTAYDGIASRYWQFGDGGTATGQSPAHSYGSQGVYTVTLWIMDGDGDNVSVTRTVAVLDTNPTVGALVTSTGQLNFTKGVEVGFTVSVIEGAEGPVYKWTISSSSGAPYITITDVPSLSYAFTRAGSFHVLVEVSDSDFSVERSIDVTIRDLPPVADFIVEHVNIDLLRITVSANTTQDQDDEITALQYNWNFGDGSDWTGWSSANRYFVHTYELPGVYRIVLMVRDPVTTVQTELNITLDKEAPVIEIGDTKSRSYVGDPIQIDVRVTDDTSVIVRLYYSLDGTNFTLVQMTPSDDLGNYSGQIPTPDDTGSIWYYVSATDQNNNTFTTDTFTIKIEVEPSMLYIWIALLAVAVLMVFVLFYLNRTRPVVDEVFIIYHDGNLIAHQARRMKPGMDDQILGSMFVALQGFVKDSFKDEASAMLKRMDFGERTIMVEKGDFIYIAVVLNGKRTGSIPPRLQKVIDSIDEKYGIELIAWDGDLEKLRGIKDVTDPLFKRVKFLELPGRNGKGKVG